MYGYKMKKPKGMPTSVWACKTSVDRYDWKNRNDSNMIEFSICKSPCRTVRIGDGEPFSVSGKSFSCVLGDSDVSGYAEDGVSVEIVSVAVRFDGLEYAAAELSDKDTEEENILLLPYMLRDLPMQDSVAIENLLYRFISENVKKDAASEMLCASLVYELLSTLDRLVRKNLKEKRKKYSNYYVLKADSIIQRRYSEKLTLKSVAGELGVTPNYLSALYKSGTGMDFSERLCELRMKKAEALVLEGGHSVLDIAQAVGFDDESHLRRRFKQYFGISVKEYRLVNKEQTLYHEKPLRKG